MGVAVRDGLNEKLAWCGSLWRVVVVVAVAVVLGGYRVFLVMRKIWTPGILGKERGAGHRGFASLTQL